jgi:O-antigen biosynthesis protein WbqV
MAERLVLMHGGTALRLGNVLGSSGSAAEIFEQQIAAGGPITLTDEDASRYFLTVDEAVNLLLTVVGEEDARVYAPVLPQSHRVAALADFLIAELAPGKTIPIETIGSRPGDKLAEKLWSARESAVPARAQWLAEIHAAPRDAEKIERGLDGLRAAVQNRDAASALDCLCALVPDYRPSERVLELAARSASGVSS